MKIRRAVAYARDRRGRLAIILTKDWNGEPCLNQFPAHIQNTIRQQPVMLEPGDAEKVWVARQKAQHVQDAVFDDILCMNATALVVLQGWDDEFQRTAEAVFVRNAPEARVHSHAPLEPLAVRIARKEKGHAVQPYNVPPPAEDEQTEDDQEHGQEQGM
jgi:hypothetical protein